MLFIAVLSCERAARPGRADRTVTRHLSQAGSYQVTTARTGRPDATDAAPGPGIDRSASTTPNEVSFVVGQIPSPNTARVCSLFRRKGSLGRRRRRLAAAIPSASNQHRRTGSLCTRKLSHQPSEAYVLDHAGIAVGDYHASRAFYEKALGPLGITLLVEPSGQAAGFGRAGRPFFWIEALGQPVRGRLHLAFRADDRATVDRFHAAALQAGATDNGAPGLREMYHPDYYGAYVIDPDGKNIEAVCHEPE